MGSIETKETPEEKAARITTEEQIERRKEIILGSVILGIILIVFVSSIFFLKYYYPKLETRAFFGDSNGTVNTLFSALAFGGIIYTILLQRKELKLQREELRETKEEMRRSAQAQESSNEYFNEQLRLNLLPIFDYTTFSNNNISQGIKITNVNNAAIDVLFHLVIKFENESVWYDFEFNKMVFNKNSIITASYDVTSIEMIEVLVNYKDIQSRNYYQALLVIQNEDVKNSKFKISQEHDLPKQISKRYAFKPPTNIGPNDFKVYWHHHDNGDNFKKLTAY